MTDRELLEMALEALEHHTELTRPIFKTNGVIGVLRAALVLPDAEPVMFAFRYSDGTYHDASMTEHSVGMVRLYAAQPAQVKRKPLTDDEIDAIWPSPEGTNSIRALARAIEQAHNIKE